MTPQWRVAARGGIIGALLTTVIFFALARSGLLDLTSDDAIHNYLMNNPEILISMSNRLQARQQAADDAARQVAVNKLGLKAFFNPKIAFITGPKDAKTTFVEFFDYNCPFCRASNKTVEAYYAKHKNDTRFAFIEYPIKGQNSVAAARIAMAARQQPDKYLDFHFAMMREKREVDPATAIAIAQKVGLDIKKLQTDERDPSISAAIVAAYNLADAANIDGTPAFIINGKIREAAMDEGSLQAMLRQ